MVSRALPVPATTSPTSGRDVVLPLVLFCLGHYFVDLYSAALGVLQPILHAKFGLNYTQAGVLGAVLVVSSSLMQPAYGYLSDRFPSRLFSALAPAVTGLFISGLTMAPSFALLVAMVWLGGAGIASFHPQAASNAVHRIKENRGRAMAIFICSGSAGLACGPAFFSAIIGRLGPHGAIWAAVPGVVISLLLVFLMPPIERREGSAPRFDWAPLRAVWRPMLILYWLVFLRSVVQVVFAQFLPLYLSKVRGYTLSEASLSLSMYLLGGAIAGLIGGHLADRFGGRAVIVVSMAGSAPLLALFVFGTGAASSFGLFVGGLLLLFTNPVNIVMAQELVPARSGTVSALMMGFAWGMAGMIFIPLAGWVSDAFSMQTAFVALIAFPVIGAILGLKLPKPARRRAEAV
jgi:FSR family fosmidomycin resistance protein-like MFS transporter